MLKRASVCNFNLNLLRVDRVLIIVLGLPCKNLYFFLDLLGNTSGLQDVGRVHDSLLCFGLSFIVALLQSGEELVDLGSEFMECRSGKAIKHGLASVKLDQPHKKANLHVVPVGDKVEKEGEESFIDSELSENHPVGEPVLVIILLFCLDCANGHQSWIHDSQSCDEDSEAVENQHK